MRRCIAFPNQKTDLMAIFDGLRPANYPHTHPQFVVYARPSQGLGDVPFFIEVRYAATQQLVHVTNTNQLHFPHRDKLVEMVMTMKGIPFPKPGLYLVELHCDAQWVADTTLELL